MKKRFSTILAIAAAAMAFSCQKVDTPVYEYTFNVGSADQTKTTLDGTTLKWETSDKVGVFANGTTNKYASISKVSPSVQFPLYLNAALAAGDKIYCYYPYDASANASSTPDVLLMNIPAAQTGDFDAMPQISLPYQVSAEMASGLNTVGDILFCNLGAVARFHIYSSNAEYQSEKIQSVKFETSTSICGDFLIDATAVDPSNASTLAIEPDGAKSVILSKVGNVASTPLASSDYDMVIAPGSYSGTVTVQTDLAKYTYTISSPKTFARSSIKPLSVNLATGERVESAVEVVMYETAFDYNADGSSYQSGTAVLGTDKGSTTGWAITYGNWNGSECAQFRVYSSGHFGILYNNFDCSKVTKVTYSAKVSNTALNLNTYYSTDSGASWIKVDTAKALTTSLATYTMIISETGEFATVRLKFEAAGTAPTSSNYQLTVDNVKIYGFGKLIKEKTIALSKDEIILPYQGTAETISVTSNGVWTAQFVPNSSYTATITPAAGNAGNETDKVEQVTISAPASTENVQITLGTVNFIDNASGATKASCVVKQALRPANGVSSDKSALELASGTGETATVKITCNWNWKAEISGSGFSIDKTSGEGAATITITSTVLEKAAGTITLTDLDDNTSTCTIAVSQVASGVIPVGTVMWKETWEGGTNGEAPSAYGFEGTTVYKNGKVTYTNSGSSTKLYDDTMATKNLLLAKKSNSGVWTVSGIPTAGKKKFTLTLETNNNAVARYAASSTTDGVTIGSMSAAGSSSPYTVTATITLSKDATTFDLTFTNGSTSNVRLDNIMVVTAE